MQGYVYVLVSPNCGYVKIGLTTKAPMLRIREINGSDNYGGFGPWELSDFREVLNCQAVESLLHTNFDDKRATTETGASELFRISPAEARKSLESLDPSLLTKQTQVDKLFHDSDFKLYLLKLFAFTGLPGWLGAQGAWTFSLYPSTGRGRYFTTNIGPHEVAFSTLRTRDGSGPFHLIVVDRLIRDFPDVGRWVMDHNGDMADDTYDRALGHSTSIAFEGSFPEAEKFFGLDGARRAMIAYWTEALIRLEERGVLSNYARFHNYNAVAKLVAALRERDGYLYDRIGATG